MTRKQRILLPVTIAALVLGQAAVAAAIDEEYAETFAFAAGGRVSLDNINGDVEITAWDSAEVKVEYTKRARTQEGIDRMEVSIDASASRIHIETDYRESGRRWFGDSSGEVEYRLWVPRDAHLDEIELVNGRLEIRGVAGDVAASLVNGDLIAEGLA